MTTHSALARQLRQSKRLQKFFGSLPESSRHQIDREGPQPPSAALQDFVAQAGAISGKNFFFPTIREHPRKSAVKDLSLRPLR